MRHALRIIALVSLSLYLQSNATLWLGYYALHEQIAAHCENKASAECSGKCQIKKLETKNDSGPLVPIHIPDLSDFIVKKSAFLLEQFSSPISFVESKRWRFLAGTSSDIFRPPISA